MRENRYLRDRMISRDRARRDYRRDGRNPYGARGGYVRDSRRGDYASDYAGDYRNDYDRADRARDRGRDYADRDYDDYDMDEAEDEFKMDLEDWCKELKHQVRNPLPKSEVLTKAEQMGVRFDEYNEKEFYATVMMLMSDFPNVGQPETYIAMAKQWLEDKDAELQGAEKLSAYYYTIVKGE